MAARFSWGVVASREDIFALDSLGVRCWRGWSVGSQWRQLISIKLTMEVERVVHCHLSDPDIMVLKMNPNNNSCLKFPGK
jgi:hypothetical protein